METSGQLRLEMAEGAILIGTPLLTHILIDINILMSTIAAICGAILAIRAVWKIYELWRKEKKRG